MKVNKLGLVAMVVGLAACGEDPPPPARTPSLPPAAVQAEDPRPQTRELRYSVVVMSRPAGGSTTIEKPDGKRDTIFAYVDNGRGPKVQIHSDTDTQGILERFDAAGTETMGNVVDEHFTFDGKTMKWASRAEKGEKPAQRAFYVPLAPYPESTGLLAKAVLANGGALPLLPEGEAKIEKTTDTWLDLPGAPEGPRRHVTSYAITGLEILPTRLWLDDDGELFAIVDTWQAFIRAGWERAADALLAIQKTLDDKRESELAKRLAKRPPAAGIAFTHARVFDADAKRWLADHTVVVVDGKIAAVGPSATTKPPAQAEVVDATNKSILPGLWDMHAHLGPGDGELDIASGVTTARDLGNDPDRLDQWKQRFDEGVAIGPHVVRAGFVEGRGEKAAGSKITAETEAEAVAAVAEYAKRGYEQIKIYNSMKPELVPVLAREAHAKGMRVSGHVPVHMRAEDVVKNGYDEIQHINMLFLNFFVDKDTDTRTTLRFSLVADKAGGLDLGSKPVKDFVKLLQEKKTVIDPTVAVFEHLFCAREGEPSPSYKAALDRLPVQVRRGAYQGGLVVPEGKDALYKQAYARAKELLKLLHASGVPLVPGTDGLAGLMLERELEIWVEAGIPVDDVLVAATLGSARVMKKDKTTGSLKPGKDADLFLVDGDPRARISDIRKVVSTMRQGVVYSSKDVYEAVGIRP
ncbi:MAG: amidohydrolase family protein [Deltaproteobacteria bacterium]|nr:amidohydrolase family protein [Deltaproteobacteria bacterium]